MIHCFTEFMWFVPLRTLLGTFLLWGQLLEIPSLLTLGYLWSFNTSQPTGTQGCWEAGPSLTKGESALPFS